MGRIILIIVFFISSFSYTQNYKAVYELTYKKNIKSDSLSTIYFDLIINQQDKISFFEDQQKETQFGKSILKNFTDKEMITYEKVGGKTFSYNDSYAQKWEIKNGFSQYLDYTVYIAKTHFLGREWEAKFTPEIPVLDGPYKFYGLPGFIVEIQSLDHDYHFKLISFSATEEEIIIPDSQYYAKDNLQSYKEVIKSNPYSLIEALKNEKGISVSASYNGKPISEKSMKESYNKDFWNWMEYNNNPIAKEELWLKPTF